MEGEQKERKKQSLNLPILTTILFLLANVIIVVSVLPSTFISSIIIVMKPAFAQEQTPTGIISKVRTLLNQTNVEYKNQNFTGAQSLATSAYLDHFEFIETPLEKQDKALENETEIMLREQLIQMIKDKSPQENIQ
jgi:hypothetical protein